MNYHCCDQLRRDAVAKHPNLNGIDFIEVIDRELPALDPLRQRTLLVHCLKPLPAGMSRNNIRLSGGARVKSIAVEWAAPATPLPPQLAASSESKVAAIVAALPDAAAVLVVRVSQPGDFSAYTLRFTASATSEQRHPSFDPQLRTIDFSFKVECPSEFDCQAQCWCPPPSSDTPDINYLAKDYGTFRRLLLDRMAQLVPTWQQTSAADFGVALMELLAYVGDQLSYQQDAIATEAYLETARRRTSLRRHALLVDYPMHDGCNARTWLQLEVETGTFTLAKSIQFFTRCPELPPQLPTNSENLGRALTTKPLVFEPLHAPKLHAALNNISFYTWGDTRCCLPRGATSATLAERLTQLNVNDVLLFEEVMGPRTGAPEDADPSHRHVVRLTSVDSTASDPLTGAAITEIVWAAEDALPFPLCISARTEEAHGSKLIADISVARGNLVLVDHGATVGGEKLGEMPAPALFTPPAAACDPCSRVDPQPVPARFRPRLGQVPLTQAATIWAASAVPGQPKTRQPFDPSAPAADAMRWDMADVLPQVSLDSTFGAEKRRWQAVRTLLNSTGQATDVVIEVEDDGGARLRFGDGEHGQRPEAGTSFTADYRVGNGSAGNVGPGSIFHIVGAQTDISKITKVRQPLPAVGGVEPESAESIRRNAPEAFRTQERAVTLDDYAAIAQRRRGIQRAAATMRWTGCWHTVFVTVDPEADADATSLKSDLNLFLDRYRMAGHDLEFNNPRYVPLELELHVCVKPDHSRSEVKQRLVETFSDRVLPDGRHGLFHPDNLTLGQSVYLGQIYAAAHAVAGVASAHVVTFQRQGIRDARYLANGQMPLGGLEIAQLANNPNFPERGVLRLQVNGGR